jgi:hypothetical protein
MCNKEKREGGKMGKFVYKVYKTAIFPFPFFPLFPCLHIPDNYFGIALSDRFAYDCPAFLDSFQKRFVKEDGREFI